MILVDADILIDVLRGHGPATAWLCQIAEPLAIVGFVAMELLQGCRNSAVLRQTRELISRYRIIWPVAPDYVRSMERFGELRLRVGLDAMDALIAETAIGLDEPLHTFNVRHFSAYPELRTIQPYTR